MKAQKISVTPQMENCDFCHAFTYDKGVEIY